MIKIFCDYKRNLYLIMLSFFTPIFILLMDYGISATSQVLGSEVIPNMGNNQSELIYSSIPSNISVTIEPEDTGTLYLSAIISNGDVNFTRNLDDELFPF